MNTKEVSADIAFGELNSAIRHYSNLRFLIVPLFCTVNAAIIYGLKNQSFSCFPNFDAYILTLTSAIFLMFATFEWALNRYIDRFVLEASQLTPDIFWSNRPETWGLVTIVIRFFYSVVGLGWWFLILSGPVCK